MTSPADRARLVALARDSIARGSKSFAMASKLFGRETRERAWLLYAWCRAADDLADGQEMGHDMTVVADPQAQLAQIRSRTEKALAGQPTGSPAFDALGIVVAEASIPAFYPSDVIDGFALDAIGFAPRTEQELYRYCYHVAGAVGCMMAIVMGVPPDDEATLDRACDLGIAFQLANIARDIVEDAAAGRCYLPRDWLNELEVPRQDMLNPDYRSHLSAMAARLADQARKYEESARYGAAALPFRSAWAVLAAGGIYGDIAREVKRRGPSAWDERVVISKADKFGWAILAGIQARNRASFPDPGRAGLWSRSTLRSAGH
jgi:15-cis-phytoene synthase